MLERLRIADLADHDSAPAQAAASNLSLVALERIVGRPAAARRRPPRGPRFAWVPDEAVLKEASDEARVLVSAVTDFSELNDTPQWKPRNSSGEQGASI